MNSPKHRERPVSLAEISRIDDVLFKFHLAGIDMSSPPRKGLHFISANWSERSRPLRDSFSLEHSLEFVGAQAVALLGHLASLGKEPRLRHVSRAPDRGIANLTRELRAMRVVIAHILRVVPVAQKPDHLDSLGGFAVFPTITRSQHLEIPSLVRLVEAL
jgi:hypothetical protein